MATSHRAHRLVRPPLPRGVIFLDHMRVRIAGAAAALLLLSACARRPTKELEDARRALIAAETAQAPIYAPSSFAEAQRTLHEAERLAGKRKYDDARIVARESAARSRAAVAMTSEN